MPRLIGLSLYSAALGSICFFKTLLSQADRGNQIESFRIMHIEPTGVAKGSFGAWHIALFRIKPAKSDGCSVMPPVVARKSFHQGNRSIRPFGLAKEV